jgi:hypothetical protein
MDFNFSKLRFVLSALISIFYFPFSFSQDTVSPTVVITQSTTDTNVLEDQTVRITGTFSENMSSSPQITIGSLITNANMTGSGSSWYYDWDVSTGNPSTGSVSVTITGTDSAGNSLMSTTPFTEALDLNGTNWPGAVQSGATDQSSPLRRDSGGGNQPWMVNAIFKRTTSDNQTIWSQREDSGNASNDDKIKLKINGSSLKFKYGRNSNFKTWTINSKILNDTWYSISVKYNGGNITKSSSFAIYETDLSTGLATEITGDGSWTTEGSPGNTREVNGEFYVGRDITAERFNGKISSVVVTTLKQGESPSLVEMAMFGQDPLAWVATYKEGKTFRATNGTSPESVNFQRLNNDKTGAQRSDFATIVWLMGDGTAGDGNNGLGTGSDYHVENEVTHSSASGSSQTRLVFSTSSNYNKIGDASLTIPARKIFNITNVSPKVSLSLSDSDNDIGVSSVVTITALFNKSMTATPTLSISGGLLSNVAFTSYTTENSQIGGDIDGEASANQLGSSVSASSNGRRIAAGAYYNTDGGSLAGHVRVYDNNGSSWQQVGSDIDGKASEAMGYSVSLSADGKRLAAGGYYGGAGVVRIYDFNGTNWVQTGLDIIGEATGDRSGWDVSLSDDGTRVAVGAPYNDAGNSSSDNRGHVRVYELQSGTWVKLGSDIDGQAAGDEYGRSVSLSSDGSRLAVGGPYHDGGNASSDNRGFVRVFDYNGSAWVQVGVDFDGTAGDQFGTDVDLSSDGTILAFGASGEDSSGSLNEGGVLIYEYTPTGVASWTQLGSTIYGSAANTQSAGEKQISISDNGSRIAIGDKTFNYGGSQNDARGETRVFDYNGSDWVQTGSDIYGEAPGDNSGIVALSGDGTLLAIGAPANDGNGSGSGHVRVHSLGGYKYLWDVDGGGTPSSGTYYVTVAGTQTTGNAYVAGTQSITFKIDSTAPTATLTDSDSDNILIASDTVTITAYFSEPMTATPTISITGLVTNVVMSSGSASFTTASIATSADFPEEVFAADMDGDGDMDIISASFNDNTIAWYENNGASDPSWTAANIATDNGGAKSVFAADIDGDGDMDIISASYNDNTIDWYKNNNGDGSSWTAANIAAKFWIFKSR